MKPSVITLADEARDLRQWERAAGYYRVALQRTPQNPPIWVQYGHVLKESGHWTGAERAYRTALAYDPGSADAHLQLGHILKIQGKTEEAKTAYLRAVAIDPSLNCVSFDFSQLGWSETHFSELRGMLSTDLGDPIAAAGVNGASGDLMARHSSEDHSSARVKGGHEGSIPFLDPAELENFRLVSEIGVVRRSLVR